MKKITVKKLIEFKRKSDKSKITFVNNLKKDKKPKNDSGGDYWITSLSAISNSFKTENLKLLDEKIEELRDKIKLTNNKNVKDQFQRNINVLENFKDFDLKETKPKSKLNYIKKHLSDMIVNINGLPIESRPRFVYSYSGTKDEEIGGIWFVAKLKGYTKTELGMFAEMIFRYIEKIHSGKYFVNPEYCIAIDVTDGKAVKYQEIIDEKISSVIESTIDELKKL
ncbi:MAG: hypothetical protein HY951_14345 [Bacteroidia bacterium]|nr:hypothetical protein [Bacteroidia bacterium]